jgi:hypothetical protein
MVKLQPEPTYEMGQCPFADEATCNVYFGTIKNYDFPELVAHANTTFKHDGTAANIDKLLQQ